MLNRVFKYNFYIKQEWQPQTHSFNNIQDNSRCF